MTHISERGKLSSVGSVKVSARDRRQVLTLVDSIVILLELNSINNPFKVTSLPNSERHGRASELHHSTLPYPILLRFILFQSPSMPCTVMRRTALPRTTLRCILFHFTLTNYTRLHCPIALHHIAPHYTTLHCTD